MVLVRKKITRSQMKPFDKVELRINSSKRISQVSY